MLLDVSVGFIGRSLQIYSKFLGPSLAGLGRVEILRVAPSGSPAKDYNKIIANTHRRYLFLTHEDVSFSHDLISRVQATIDKVKTFGALGLVGASFDGQTCWSSVDEVHKVSTLDCCFIILDLLTWRQEPLPEKRKKADCILPPDVRIFDEVNFGGLHLYVEDLCARLSPLPCYTLLTNSKEAPPNKAVDRSVERGSFLDHHSVTVGERGYAWGDYPVYKKRFLDLHPTFRTT